MEDRLGRPAEVHAVDASTVRAAEVKPIMEKITSPTDIEDEDGIKWVQIVNGQVVVEFTGSQLAFGVRNPRTGP